MHKLSLHTLRQPKRSAGRHGGFTLVELLVVLAIIAILAGLLLPTLAKARAKAYSTICLNNHRQVSLAFQMYSDDHEGRLPYNSGADGIRATVAAKRYANWVNDVMSWESDSDNTNTFLVTAGGLGPYFQAPTILKCPSDTALSDIQREAGWKNRVRSLSLNAMVGYAGGFLDGVVNTNNPNYKQYFKLSDIPAPASIFTFVDEHPDSINDGYFLNRVATLEWVDLPASYHNGAANFSFADGHSEPHQWLFPRTKPAPRPDSALLPMAVPATERTDYDWLTLRTSTYRQGTVEEHNY